MLDQDLEPDFDALFPAWGLSFGMPVAGLAESTAPFAAPPSAEEALARLRLARSRRVGPATYRRLLAQHGDARAALAALPEIAHATGVEGYAPCDEGAARAEMRAGAKRRATLLTLGDPAYPPRLSGIADAPPVIWVEGEVAALARPSVAVVGTRNASSLGLRMARALARDLAEAGHAVVSGLAKGIDAAAHEAALRADGAGTVAVHAGGLDRPYPEENAELARRIAAEGAAVSERPYGYGPRGRDFPRRNRIVSGLARAVVVVEAALRSGSMLTARDALDQGREVLVVPGHPLDTRASGCNALLRDGAILVRGAEDVLEALTDGDPPAAPRAPRPDAPPPPQAPGAADPAARILALLSPVPTSEDAVLRELAAHGVPGPAAAAALSALEIEGHIARRPGAGLVRL
jgi:DNA processing protein